MAAKTPSKFDLFDIFSLPAPPPAARTRKKPTKKPTKKPAKRPRPPPEDPEEDVQLLEITRRGESAPSILDQLDDIVYPRLPPTEAAKAAAAAAGPTEKEEETIQRALDRLHLLQEIDIITGDHEPLVPDYSGTDTVDDVSIPFKKRRLEKRALLYNAEDLPGYGDATIPALRPNVAEITAFLEILNRFYKEMNPDYSMHFFYNKHLGEDKRLLYYDSEDNLIRVPSIPAAALKKYPRIILLFSFNVYDDLHYPRPRNYRPGQGWHAVVIDIDLDQRTIKVFDSARWITNKEQLRSLLTGRQVAPSVRKIFDERIFNPDLPPLALVVPPVEYQNSELFGGDCMAFSLWTCMWLALSPERRSSPVATPPTLPNHDARGFFRYVRYCVFEGDLLLPRAFLKYKGFGLPDFKNKKILKKRNKKTFPN